MDKRESRAGTAALRVLRSVLRRSAQGRYGELCIEQRVFCLADAARERGFTVRTLVRVG